MNKLYLLFRLLCVLLAITLLLTPFGPRQAHAQTSDETTWTTPTNLSNSGLTSLPSIVSDQNGIVHAFWADDTLGTLYSQLADGVWSQPAITKTPFSGFAPVLVDGGSHIHAFWIDINSGSLFHSRVAIGNVGAGSWDRTKTLAKGVIDFKAAYQPDNTLHLAYMVTLESSKNPAGTYYLRTTDGGTRWETAKPIYTSRYFRDLDPALVNVDIAVAAQDGGQVVYSVWNDPALKRVYLSTSLDGGGTWGAPFEVDGPSVENSTGSPFNPMVTASGSEILLLWQSNLQSGFACSQYYQVSDDGGATWVERGRILTEFVGCPQENLFLSIEDGLTLLQTTIRDEVYLVAWNGESWSKAYLQSPLSDFGDPSTNEPVTFRCRQSTVKSGATLFVIGCDEEGNKDIWVQSRIIGGVETWYPTVTLWNDPVMVVDSSLELSSAQAVVDEQDVLHVFWLEVDQSVDSKIHRSIHYVRFKDDLLTQPARILVSPDKIVQDYSVTYDRSRGRLYVVWTTGTTGEIYFSWAEPSRAASTFEWTEPVALPDVPTLVKSPNLLITPDGTIYVAYAIPVNEDRGIYLMSSTDGGMTWGPTIQLYGVTEPEWQAIDFPKLASTGDEILHALWTRERIYGEADVVGLYYARSEDRGQTWSAPQVVSDVLTQGAWLVDGADEGVHRFWLTSVGAESGFYHDGSIDQGANWIIQDNLTGFGEVSGIASPYVDPGGKINFAQAVANSPGNLIINHQQNDGGRWTILDSLVLGDALVDEITSLSAQELTTGRLIIAYTFNETQPAENETPYRLYLASQSQDVVQTTATAEIRLATPVPLTPEPAATLDATELAETLAPTESIIPLTPYTPLSTGVSGNQPVAIDTFTGLALSGGLALLVVAVFFLFTRLRRP